jgi:hypothetical protein
MSHLDHLDPSLMQYIPLRNDISNSIENPTPKKSRFRSLVESTNNITLAPKVKLENTVTKEVSRMIARISRFEAIFWPLGSRGASN